MRSRGAAAGAGIASVALAAFLFLAPLPGAFGPAFSGQGLLGNLADALAGGRLASILGFTVLQALASTALAVVVGIPAAFLVARREFPGRRLLSAMSSVPFCIPPMLVALGFVLYYGRQGLLNRLLMGAFHIGEPPVRFLYGFWGVVVAHGFYNFPIVMRTVSDLWSRLPPSRAQAARSLGAGEARVFLDVTLRELSPALGASATLVFLFCFFSFPIVLLFGGLGGSTPEVEIYRAARISLDFGRASSLAVLETALALFFVILYAALESRLSLRLKGMGSPLPRKRLEKAEIAAGGLFIAFLLVFFLGPLLSIAANAFVERRGHLGEVRLGLANFLRLARSGSLGSAFRATLVLGLGTALVSAVSGFSLAVLLRGSRFPGLSRAIPMTPLAVSGTVLALGWSALVARGAPLLIILAQTASAYPFVYRAVGASLSRVGPELLDAARSLGSSRVDTALRVELPMAARGLLTGMAFAFSISAGDMNVLLILPIRNFEPLSLLLYRLTSAYRFGEACAVGVILALITGFIFFLRDEAAEHG